MRCFPEADARLALLVTIGSIASGCGTADKFPATFPVSGSVTLNGAPVNGASVSFIAAGGGPGADTFTEADGSFTVQTAFAQGKEYRTGMMPGDYQVTIQKLDFDAARGTGLPPRNSLPDKYADPASSGLTATVSESGPNVLTFELAN